MASWNVLQRNSGGTYCCREASDTSNCCSNSSAIVSIDIETLVLTMAASTASTGTAAGTTTTAVITAAPTGDSSSNGTIAIEYCPADKSALVGGTVGGALGAALLASLGALAFVTRRRRREIEGPDTAARPQFLEQHSKPLQHYNGVYIPPQELPDAGRALHEMN